LNEAQVEACKRTDLLIETVTIPMTDGSSVYDMPASALKAKRVKYKSKELTPVLYQDDAIEGAPSTYMITTQAREITLDRFVSIVTINDVLSITISKMPTARMVDDTDLPEIAEHFALALCYWAVRLLLLDADPDTQDPQKSERFAVLFADVFGVPLNAQAIAINQRANNTRIRATARFL